MAKVKLDQFGTDKGLSLGGMMSMFSRGGQIVVTAWPTKRGKAKTQQHQQRINYFTNMNKLAKRSTGQEVTQVRDAVAGTPYMPRDFFLSFSAGRAVQVFTPDGIVYRSYRGMIQTSFALDQITIKEGQGLYRDADKWIGKDWPTGGGGGGTSNWWFDPPLAADLTVLSPDTPDTLTLTDDDDAGLLIDTGAPVSGDHSRFAYRSLSHPTLDFDAILCVKYFVDSLNYSGIGLYLRDSVGGHMLCLGTFSGYTWQVEKLNSNTSFNSNVKQIAIGSRKVGRCWYRLAVSASVLYAYISPDGKAWQQAWSEGLTTWFPNGIDQVGPGVTYNRTAGMQNMLAVEMFSLTGSAV